MIKKSYLLPLLCASFSIDVASAAVSRHIHTIRGAFGANDPAFTDPNGNATICPCSNHQVSEARTTAPISTTLALSLANSTACASETTSATIMSSVTVQPVPEPVSEQYTITCTIVNSPITIASVEAIPSPAPSLRLFTNQTDRVEESLSTPTSTSTQCERCHFITPTASDTPCYASVAHNRSFVPDFAHPTTSPELTYDSMGSRLTYTIRSVLGLVVLGAAAWLTVIS